MRLARNQQAPFGEEDFFVHIPARLDTTANLGDEFLQIPVR
jgi:hypothetical protein